MAPLNGTYKIQMLSVLVCLTVVSSGLGFNTLRESEKLAEEILNNLLSETSYSALMRPAVTTNVSINTHIRNINFLDDLKMELGLQIILRVVWMDYRLNYENFTTKLNKSLIPENIIISDASRVWYPDIFVLNEKKGTIHDILKPNVQLRIHRNGTVLFSTRITLVLDCPMRLNWYPFDRHKCPVAFASYALQQNELRLEWQKPDPVTAWSPGLELPKFTLLSIDIEARRKTYGDYMDSILYLQFRREFSYYLVNIFMPSVMMVFISWISFWFDVAAIEARVTLGVTTILTMVTQNFGFNQTAPVVSYAKVIDIFCGTCLVFIAMALLEFAFVDNTLRKYSGSTSKLFHKPDPALSDGSRKIIMDANMAEARFQAMRIDRLARILFPAVFISFLTIYFAICFTH